jgi:hypothetical protein
VLHYILLWFAFYINHYNLTDMKKCSLLLFILFLLAAGNINAQNVGIGTTHPQQKLHVAGGLRVDTLSNGKDSGLLRHNPDGTVFSLTFTGDSTQVLRGNGTFGTAAIRAAPLANPWLLGGNAGTSSDSNFLGTTDTAALRFRINNQWAGELDSVHASTFFGYGAGKTSTLAFDNTAIGYQALNANTRGFANTAVGQQALLLNNGIFNSAFGSGALFNNSTGNDNLGMGPGALFLNTSGNNNTALGFQAAHGNTSGFSNVAVGINTLFSNQTGNNLVAIGDSALFNQASGIQNTAIGSKALFSNAAGSANTAVGFQALFSGDGSNNTAVGFEALTRNTTGVGNVAMGIVALANNLGGNGNVAIGPSAMEFSTSAQLNTAVGSSTFANLTTGQQNTALGFQAELSSGDLNNATALGAGALVNASNKVRIGNVSVTVIEGQVAFSHPSDGRFKFNIREDVKGLDFILRLRPISYQFDVRKLDQYSHPNAGRANSNDVVQASYNEAMAVRHTGFIAQEVEVAAQKSDYAFTGVIRPRDEEDHYSLNYESFIMPLVKAVQEEERQIDDLKKMVAQQQRIVADQQKMIEQLLKNK